jgi:hypothetical protein
VALGQVFSEYFGFPCKFSFHRLLHTHHLSSGTGTMSQLVAQVRSRGICGGQSGAGAGFLRVLRFPLPIFIPPIAPQSPSSIIRGWYNRPVVAAVPSGLSLTPLIIIIKNNHTVYYNRRTWACCFMHCNVHIRLKAVKSVNCKQHNFLASLRN